VDMSLLAIEETLDRLSGDRELMVSLFELYQSDAPTKIQEIEIAMTAGDFFRVERLAHSVKGASATVGAAQVLVLAADLEKAAKAHDSNRMQALFVELRVACEQAMTAMKEFAAGV